MRLRGVGVRVGGSEASPEGRGGLSQAMSATGKNLARRAAEALAPHLTAGRDILVIEPSALAMFRRDYRHLLDDRDQFERLRERTVEPVEYIARLLEKSGRSAVAVFDVKRSPVGP